MRVLGLRATATGAGLFTLTRELLKAGVLSDEALERIKESMVRELSIGRPLSAPKEAYEKTVRQRLDGLFSGAERVSPPPKFD
jgi:hypothetical protein